ncbi:type III secretion system ATPase SctN [Pseudomonas sp. SBB6]|uniref:type III secretion system ATPase SctN n=1 Tax=Pseudomonas sp. SBB6 TaxID=2962032 RepID=UPI0020B8A634|nr:type III secretion system ATPase SctN [Pseudomonas sp. SBB6]MCP3749307.1 type III secretion system ATPase SctN [Pseudomonas sp. SBB6]
MTLLQLARQGAHPRRSLGPLLEVPLAGVAIGELCEVFQHWRDPVPRAWAQVIGFNAEVALLSLLGEPQGLSRQSLVMATGAPMHLYCGDDLLGAVLDARGQVVERLAPAQGLPVYHYGLDNPPPHYSQRRPVSQRLDTAIRVIDTLLTCGVGQRVGIFAAAGTGKTSLLDMLVEHSEADVFVIGLIGERGREVAEFVQRLRGSARSSRSVVVQASSDSAAVDRCNAALVATSVAEYFRDCGQRVVLLIDSLSRYARARRDLALAAGEAPARRGYPASVFEALPRLLERPGVTASGSITAFYTVLLESDDEPDPLAEEIRSILDGHIYLSRELAGKGHFPAIDVLRSTSRVAHQVCSVASIALAGQARECLARLQAMRLLLELGEYQSGVDPLNDQALARRDDLQQWLRQSSDQAVTADDAEQALHALFT